jgi:hypothetical protein
MFARLSMQVQWILLGPKRAFAGEFVVARKFSRAVSQRSAAALRAWMKIQFLPQTSGKLGGDRLVGLLFSQQLLIGLRPTHVLTKIQSLPLTRGRFGGGGLNPLFSNQVDKRYRRKWI